MHTEKIIERAVTGGTSRLAAAVRSVCDFRAFESDRLRREKVLFEEELRKGLNRNDVHLALRQNRAERLALSSGWEHSSVRRALKSLRETGQAEASAIESRAALTAPVVPELDDRATAAPSATTAKQLVGHAAVFNRWATIGGWFREQVAPGAFTEVLKTADVRFLFNHDPHFIFGRTTANTLELAEDQAGLAFTCYLLAFDASSYGLARRIDRGDISGCSFSFTVKRETWRFAQKAGELDERTILEIGQLYDVAAVVYPAYPATDVTATFARASESDSLAESKLRQLEGRLRRVKKEQERHVNESYQRAGRILNRLRCRN